jgi:RNA-directed DNA polymerase
MTKTSITLQELRKRIYTCAKADKQHRFWGLYVHMYKMETLQHAYRLTKANEGSPGIDGLTFEQIEQEGAGKFLLDIQQTLMNETYRPMRNRIKLIDKGEGKFRKLGIPSIRERVVQGALKLIIEPIFEADFQEGSFGYLPRRRQHDAVQRVQQAMLEQKTRVIDLDLRAYFDTVKHSILLKKIVERINDDKVMHLIKLMLKVSGKEGVPEGGVASALFSNIYLNEVDKMLEKAIEATRKDKYTHIQYARWADDCVILVDGRKKWEWLWQGINRRLLEELAELQVKINEEKTKSIDLAKGESFVFLGFEMRIVKTKEGKDRPNLQPGTKTRKNVLAKLKAVFHEQRSQKLERVGDQINPILKGWADYYRIGHSARIFAYVKRWLEFKIRRHLMRSRLRQGFGWKRWSTPGLFAMYNI